MYIIRNRRINVRLIMYNWCRLTSVKLPLVAVDVRPVVFARFIFHRSCDISMIQLGLTDANETGGSPTKEERGLAVVKIS